jgi:hypothetical protein
LHSDQAVRDWIGWTLIPAGRTTVAAVDGPIVGLMAVSNDRRYSWIDHLYLLPVGLDAASARSCSTAPGASSRHPFVCTRFSAITPLGISTSTGDSARSPSATVPATKRSVRTSSTSGGRGRHEHDTRVDDCPFSLESLANPNPFHEELREAGPVVWLERYGIWAMARHEEVRASLMSSELVQASRVIELVASLGAEDVAQRYRQFADRECREYSQLYYELAVAVSEDPAILEFIATMPITQPNLFFAAVQFLTGPADMPKTASQLRELVKARDHQIADVMRSHRTQTNEVGRCAILLPALPPGPLALVEVGASAGLCLLLDRFHYQLGSTTLGEPASPVHLRCRTIGPVPVPTAIPTIVWHRGLDANPIDVHDEEAVRWLLACVWADHPDRRRRLEGAIDLARAHPPAVSAGDLVDDLPSVLAGVPDDAQLVVFHSAVLGYVDLDRRHAFGDVLADVSKRRDLVWLSNEAPGVLPEMTALAPPRNERQFLLGRTRFANGQPTRRTARPGAPAWRRVGVARITSSDEKATPSP